MKKTKKKPNTPGRTGRPKKNHVARRETSVFLPVDLIEELDGYVRDLRTQAAGSSRGDVISAALGAFGPFRLWRSTRGGKTRP